MDAEAKAFLRAALIVSGVVVGMLLTMVSTVGIALFVPFAVYGCIFQLTWFIERRRMLKEAATADLDAELRKLQGE